MHYLCFGSIPNKGNSYRDCQLNMKPFPKLYLFLLLCLAFFMGSQSAEAQWRKEEYKQITIEKGIEVIAKKYNVTFSYSSDLINLSKKIDLNLKDQTLNEALTSLSDQALVEYKIINAQVILSPRKKTLGADLNKKYIHGYVRDLYTKELLPDILIYCSSNNSSTFSNKYGYYSIQVPANIDSVELQAHIIGYKVSKRRLPIISEQMVNWDLESSIKLEVIEINDQRVEDKAFHKSMIADVIDPELRENTPRMLGQKDALTSTRYLAGVNRETDISSGYNIRGGRIDQNLIILDDAPLYHSFHLFGMYSVFNEDALKQMNVLKGGFPARYGGRLSSVVELITKDGNLQDYKVEVGTGIISSHFGIEGPIVKNKLSFFINARASHVKELVQVFQPDNPFGYRFYDINTKLQWKINDKHRLFFSYYKGSDVFDQSESDSVSNALSSYLGWGNSTATFRWNHLFHPKWFANTSLIFTNYNIESEQGDTALQITFGSSIRDLTLKYDVDYFHSNLHHFKAGFQVTTHKFTPDESINLTGFISNNSTVHLINEEFAAYIEDEIKFSDKFSTNIGLRYSGYKYKEVMKFNPEPRVMFTYLLNPKVALKASYGRMYQYSHYLNSFVGIGLPTDLWLPSTDKLRPESSDQSTLGAYFNDKKHWKLNVEAFYKYQSNILAYGPNSSLLSSLLDPTVDPNATWEEKTIEGLAKIYGTELQAEYYRDRLRFIFAYTLSFSKNKFIESGYKDWYWASNDRRHNISLVNMFRLSKHWSINTTWIFTTGTPFTLPESSYYVNDNEPGYINLIGSFGPNQYYAYDYKGVNTYRMSNYHRLDLNFMYSKQFKKSKWELQAGAMNIYNRKNAIYYMVSYNETTGQNELRKMAFFGIVPSFSINVNF